MLFKKLFIATLAALALVGCNDDNDIDNPVLTDAGDVNVVFATSSSEQAVTKSEGISTTVYGNFTSTDDVYEYCLKKKVDDPEFVIDHMTVFVFDEKGGLVKTAYFEDVLDAKKGESMNLPDKVEGANSICEFGGIVLKAGTYNFILAGNLTKAQIKAETETFEDYKNAAITWEDKDKNKCISSQIAATHLPMVKVLNKIKLIAKEKTANATLNLIMDNATEDELEAKAPDTNTDENLLSVPSAIQLTRLVARIQLKSLAFDWTNADNVKPAVSTTLKNIYLANASNTVKLYADNGTGTGLVNGLSSDYQYLDEKSMISFGEVASTDNTTLAKAVTGDATVTNGNKIYWRKSETEETEETKKEKLPLYFYAFPKKGVLSGENVHANWEIMMVLNCGDDESKNVYYYVPIRDKDDVSNEVNVVANKIYNLNVKLIGQGSDIPGKKIEKVNVVLGLSVGDWLIGDPIIIDGNPTPVNN